MMQIRVILRSYAYGYETMDLPRTKFYIGTNKFAPYWKFLFIDQQTFQYENLHCQSKVDYGIVNEETWGKVEEFRRGERVELDHLPLEISTAEMNHEEGRKRGAEEGNNKNMGQTSIGGDYKMADLKNKKQRRWQQN